MAKAKDPICGMMVDTETAKFKGEYGGQMVYFCNPNCQKTYESQHGKPR